MLYTGYEAPVREQLTAKFVHGMCLHAKVLRRLWLRCGDSSGTNKGSGAGAKNMIDQMMLQDDVALFV